MFVPRVLGSVLVRTLDVVEAGVGVNSPVGASPPSIVAGTGLGFAEAANTATDAINESGGGGTSGGGAGLLGA